MAERVDLGQVASLPDEGIVFRHAPIVSEPHDLSEVRARLLRRPRDVALAERDVEQSVFVPRETRTEAAARGSDGLIRRRFHRLGDEDVFAVAERRAAIPARAIDRGRRVPTPSAGFEYAR